MDATPEFTPLAGTDLPHTLAHSLSHKLMEVFTLLRVGVAERDREPEFDARDDMTDAESRSDALIAMAQDKVREVLREMAPYV